MIQDNSFEQLEQFDYIDWDIIEEKKYNYAPEIWLFLIEFSKFDHHLNLELSELFSDRAHVVGYIVIAQLAISTKLELYKKFLTRKIVYLSTLENKEKNIQKLDKFIKLAKSIIEFRNIISHCNWFSLKEKGMIRIKTEFNTSSSGFVAFKNRQIYPRTIRSYTIKIMKALIFLSKLSSSEF